MYTFWFKSLRLSEISESGAKTFLALAHEYPNFKFAVLVWCPICREFQEVVIALCLFVFFYRQAHRHRFGLCANAKVLTPYP